MIHKLKKVKARYPKMNQPYIWSDADNRYIGCAADETGAAFYCDAFISAEVYNDLQEKCEQVWKEFCQKREQENKPIKEPKKFRLPLDEDNEGRGYCKMKLPTYGEEKTVVRQWDSAGERLPNNFALTSNSTMHCQFLIKGYKNGSQQGLTLKLTDIQVIELAEPMERPSPFEAEEGGFKASDAPNGHQIKTDDDEEPELAPDKGEDKKSDDSEDFFDDQIPF